MRGEEAGIRENNGSDIHVVEVAAAGFGGVAEADSAPTAGKRPGVVATHGEGRFSV